MDYLGQKLRDDPEALNELKKHRREVEIHEAQELRCAYIEGPDLVPSTGFPAELTEDAIPHTAEQWLAIGRPTPRASPDQGAPPGLPPISLAKVPA